LYPPNASENSSLPPDASVRVSTETIAGDVVALVVGAAAGAIAAAILPLVRAEGLVTQCGIDALPDRSTEVYADPTTESAQEAKLIRYRAVALAPFWHTTHSLS
jgi:hypothetical protein